MSAESGKWWKEAIVYQVGKATVSLGVLYNVSQP